MNDVEELKRFVVVHARGQRIAGYEDVLARIEHDGTGPGSWTGEWCAVAEKLAGEGRHLESCRHFTMARFPFVDGPARREATARAVAELDHWRFSGGLDVHSLEVPLGGDSFRCWTSGLSRRDPKPLLLVMGGIVTAKEQWAPLLARVGKLGMAGIVTELPGVGENGLRYEAGSATMLTGLLDAVSDRADVARTYAMALSFSGHLALSCALQDARVRAVITTGAPIGPFFTDADWHARVPKLTLDTLAHLTATEPERLSAELRPWALTAENLASLDIPVRYVASSRDEIIPPGDVALLREHVRDLRVLEHDDVHGAPDHTRETQLWSTSRLFETRGVSNLQSAVFGWLLRAERARGRLAAMRS